MLQQLCNDTSDTVLIETKELPENGLQLQSGVTPLFSMRTVLLVSLQSCHNIDADAWCKQALMDLREAEGWHHRLNSLFFIRKINKQQMAPLVSMAGRHQIIKLRLFYPL